MLELQTDPEIICPPYPQRTQPGVNNEEERYGVTIGLAYMYMLTATCCPVTSCSFEQHVSCISAFIYVTVDLYPFVSSNRRATNWQQFYCRYTSNMLTATGHIYPATCCPGVITRLYVIIIIII